MGFRFKAVSNPSTLPHSKHRMEPSSAHAYSKPKVKSSRMKDETSSDFHAKADHFTQPDVRIKTSLGGYRSNSPKFMNKKGMKPKSSARHHRKKHLFIKGKGRQGDFGFRTTA